jgi:hypothetical protein
VITKEDSRKAVFTSKKVIDSNKAILYVIHDEENEWQFLTSEIVSAEDLIMLTLEQMLDIDKTVQPILSLKKGYEASRRNQDSSWVIVKSK